MDYLWEIVKRDGTTVEIVPSAVNIVRKRWDAGEPIHLPDMTIPAHQITDFRRTSRPYSKQNLLEAASQAFTEPMYEQDGSIVCKWVKTEVTGSEFATQYSKSPAYHKLASEGGMTIVAFRLPVHEINVNKTPYCTDDEVRKLTRH